MSTRFSPLAAAELAPFERLNDLSDAAPPPIRWQAPRGPEVPLDSVELEVTEVAKPTFDRAAHCRQIASLGGRKTVDTYGRKFMSEIGKIGFDAYAGKYHDGQRGKAAAALRGVGRRIG